MRQDSFWIRKKHTLCASALAIAVAAPQTSNAQLDEIIVQAQKRQESAQDVPIAVSALSADFIRETNIINIDQAIPLLAGVTGSTAGVSTTFWAIRGVSTTDFSIGSEPSVAVYLDEAYIGRNTLATGAFFDLASIEALKGPQGTLFGRNAAAGAITVRTNTPSDETSARLSVGVGDEGQRRYEAAVNLAASDGFALRAAYLGNRYEGLWTNVVTAEEGFQRGDSFRVSTRLSPSDRFEALASFNYGDQSSNINGVYNPGLSTVDPGDFFPEQIATNVPGRETLENYGGHLRLTYDLSDSISLTSISDYRQGDYTYDQDVDGSNADATIDALLGGISGGVTLNFRQEDTQAKTFSQELRLGGSSGAFDWFIGANYFFEDLEETQILDAFTTVAVPGVFTVGDLIAGDRTTLNGENNSYGIFGDARWGLTDALSVTAGLRWTYDDKAFCSEGSAGFGLIAVTTPGPICSTENWSEFTPRFVVDYRFTDDVMAYASVSRGYKAGGFNPAAIDVDADFIGDELAPFDPESNLTYELGLKSELFDRRVRFNAAAFYSDYKDIQVQTATIAGIIITNAAEAEIFGGEAELTYQINDNLTLNTSYAHVSTEYTGGGALDGNSLIYAPENTFTANFNYVQPLFGGEVSLFGLYTYQSSFFNTPDNNTTLQEPGYGLASARLAYRSGNGVWELAGRIDNLFDKEYANVRQDIGLGTGPQINRGLPRRFLVTLTLDL